MSDADRNHPPTGGTEGDTTIALKSLEPFSSDGPTLAIIGHENGQNAALPESQVNQRDASSAARPRKKQKTSAGAVEVSHSVPKTDLGPLHMPWTLLSPKLRTAVEERLGDSWWGSSCITVVFSRNQNIKNGINRLKGYLGYEQRSNPTTDLADKLGKESLVVAVSAQGEGTTKMVGIVEVVKRVVAPPENEDGETWYLYTSLASRFEEKKNRPNQGQGTQNARDQEAERDQEEEDGFEAREVQSREVKGRKVPVLTAWMSRKPIPEFKKAFGEQTFMILQARDED